MRDYASVINFRIIIISNMGWSESDSHLYQQTKNSVLKTLIEQKLSAFRHFEVVFRNIWCQAKFLDFLNFIFY